MALELGVVPGCVFKTFPCRYVHKVASSLETEMPLYHILYRNTDKPHGCPFPGVVFML